VKLSAHINVLLTRGKGQSKFTNVTTELTMITFIDSTGRLSRVAFESGLAGLFLELHNNGLRLAQLRFYQYSNLH